MVRHSLIKKTYWTLVQIHATVDSLAKDDLMDLVRRFLSVLHMDFLVHGNFTTEVSYIKIYIFFYFAPNLEKVEGAYYFCFIHSSIHTSHFLEVS